MSTRPSALSLFGRSVSVFPVIHLANAPLAAEEFRKVLDAGATGAFLVDHENPSNPRRTLDALDAMRTAAVQAGCAKARLGVNFLARRVGEAIAVLTRYGYEAVEMIWSDSAGYEPHRPGAFASAVRAVNALRAKAAPRPVLFGGFAFKGQPAPVDFEQEAKQVAEVYDVLTTSGPATGVACPADKVRRVRAAIGPGVPLAVASGVSVENAPALVAAGADVLLVASSIAYELDFYRLDPAKLRALLAAVAP